MMTVDNLIWLILVFSLGFCSGMLFLLIVAVFYRNLKQNIKNEILKEFKGNKK